MVATICGHEGGLRSNGRNLRTTLLLQQASAIDALEARVTSLENGLLAPSPTQKSQVARLSTAGMWLGLFE